MKMLRRAAILALFLFTISLLGCGGGEKNVNSQSVSASSSPSKTVTAARTNLEELTLLVNVPFDVENVDWEEDAARNNLIAVLRFSPADANKIVAESEKHGSPQNVQIAVETWFPVELIAQGEMSGDSSLKGVAYPANSFYQEPYTSGRITRIEGGDYFVLELSSK